MFIHVNSRNMLTAHFAGCVGGCGRFLANSFRGEHTHQSYHAHGDHEVLEQGASNVINAAQKAADEASRNTQKFGTVSESYKHLST